MQGWVDGCDLGRCNLVQLPPPPCGFAHWATPKIQSSIIIFPKKLQFYGSILHFWTNPDVLGLLSPHIPHSDCINQTHSWWLAPQYPHCNPQYDCHIFPQWAWVKVSLKHVFFSASDFGKFTRTNRICWTLNFHSFPYIPPIFLGYASHFWTAEALRLRRSFGAALVRPSTGRPGGAGQRLGAPSILWAAAAGAAISGAESGHPIAGAHQPAGNAGDHPGFGGGMGRWERVRWSRWQWAAWDRSVVFSWKVKNKNTLHGWCRNLVPKFYIATLWVLHPPFLEFETTSYKPRSQELKWHPWGR